MRLFANTRVFIALPLLILPSLLVVESATAAAGNQPQNNQCTASGSTIKIARSNYSSTCDLPRHDCDQVDGVWICASYKIDSRSSLISNPNTYSPANTPATAASVVAVSANTCVDSDGDGWGWDGTSSCRMNESRTVQVLDRSDSSVVSLDSSFECSGSYGPNDITDMILVTGQSNVTGAQTSVAGSFDRYGRVTAFHHPDKSHPRVFAWTVESRTNNGTGWKVADLAQSWHDSSPGVGGYARNNFAFHFAKKVAASDCRVVGIIMVSEGGRGISHWDDQSTGWKEVNRHVNEAMSAIGRSRIDGILWHQGESDWIIDGTCYTGSTCRNNQPDYYPQKLYSNIADKNIPNPIGRNSLIDRFRRQSWFNSGSPFIAGETLKAPVNVHLNKLNGDGDNWTACVAGSDASGIGIRDDDPHRNHYNAAGLRELGGRYAAAYLAMKVN